MQTASYTGQLTNCSGNRLIVRFFFTMYSGTLYICAHEVLHVCVCERACSFSPVVCECMHARAYTYVPAHITLLTSWSSDIMSPWRQAFGGLQKPAAPCQPHTHRNRSLVLHLRSRNTMPTLEAKQESLQTHTHTHRSECDPCQRWSQIRRAHFSRQTQTLH